MMRDGKPTYETRGPGMWIVWKLIAGVGFALNLIGDIALNYHRVPGKTR